MADATGTLRGLHLLEALAGMEQPAGLGAITERTGLSQAQCYRGLRALQEQGYVDHLGRSGYRLGTRSVALASLLGPRPTVLRAAHPVLTRLVTRTSESTALHLRSGEHRVLVLGLQGPREQLRDVVVLGERAPLTSGAGGLPILANLPPAEQATLIARRPPGEPRPGEHLLTEIRERGYALSFSANHSGMNGIGAALLDPDNGYPLGSIALAAPAARMPEAQLHLLSTPLRAACAELAPRLATLLGPSSTQRLTGLDVTVQGVLDV